MLTVPHIVAGAAIGSLLPETTTGLVVAFGVGVASHYVLDSLPHWERLFGPKGSDFSTDVPLSQWPKLFFYHAAADVLLALLLLVILLQSRGELGQFWLSPVFWGGIGGFFPDIVDHVPVWNRFLHRLPIFSQLFGFHEFMHISPEDQDRAPKYLGILTQVIIVTLSLWVLSSAF